MKNDAIQIECPEDLLLALGTTREQFEHEARFALAAKLYELGRLSSGKAARMAGMDRVTFLLSLHRIGVAAIAMTEDDIEDDLRYARGE